MQSVGNYSRRRQEFQDKIIQKLLSGTAVYDVANGRVGKTPNDPWIVFTAGVMVCIHKMGVSYYFFRRLVHANFHLLPKHTAGRRKESHHETTRFERPVSVAFLHYHRPGCNQVSFSRVPRVRISLPKSCRRADSQRGGVRDRDRHESGPSGRLQRPC